MLCQFLIRGFCKASDESLILMGILIESTKGLEFVLSKRRSAYRTRNALGTFSFVIPVHIQFSFPLKVVVLGKTNTTESILTIPIRIPPKAPASPPSASRLAFLSHLLYNPSLPSHCPHSLLWSQPGMDLFSWE